MDLRGTLCGYFPASAQKNLEEEEAKLGTAVLHNDLPTKVIPSVLSAPITQVEVGTKLVPTSQDIYYLCRAPKGAPVLGPHLLVLGPLFPIWAPRSGSKLESVYRVLERPEQPFRYSEPWN